MRRPVQRSSTVQRTSAASRVDPANPHPCTKNSPRRANSVGAVPDGDVEDIDVCYSQREMESGSLGSPSASERTEGEGSAGSAATPPQPDLAGPLAYTRPAAKSVQINAQYSPPPREPRAGAYRDCYPQRSSSTCSARFSSARKPGRHDVSPKASRKASMIDSLPAWVSNICSPFTSRRTSTAQHSSGRVFEMWSSQPMARIQHVNMVHWFRRLEFMPRMLQLSTPTLLTVGLLGNIVVCVIFAVLYYACGSECYELTPGVGEFGFTNMLWLSVHAFSTIGFGTVAPICHSSQSLIVFEHFASLILSSIVVTVFLFKFLRPHPLVRFSSNLLFLENADVDGFGAGQGPHFNFRIVRESYYPLRHCEVNVKCVMSKRVGKGVNVVPLKMRISSMHELELWEIWHAIDAGSPLFQKLDLLKQIYVQLTVFDTAYAQETRINHEYDIHSFKLDARFTEMLSEVHEEANTIHVDHGMLDAIEPTIHVNTQMSRKLGLHSVSDSAPQAPPARSGRSTNLTCAPASQQNEASPIPYLPNVRSAMW